MHYTLITLFLLLWYTDLQICLIQWCSLPVEIFLNEPIVLSMCVHTYENVPRHIWLCIFHGMPLSLIDLKCTLMAFYLEKLLSSENFLWNAQDSCCPLLAIKWHEISESLSTYVFFFCLVKEGEITGMYRDIGRCYMLPPWHDFLWTTRIVSDPPPNGLHGHWHFHNTSPANLVTCGEGEWAYGCAILRH